MTDSTDNAPDRIAFRKAYMSHAITSGPLMDHPDYVQYIRADLAPDPLGDARVTALVVAAARVSYLQSGGPRTGIQSEQWNTELRTALAALSPTGGNDDG